MDFDNFIGFDTTFEINEFTQPKLLSNIELVRNIVLYVLFSKPGQYPSLPEVGMDLGNFLYSFYDEIDENLLKQRLIEQCEALGLFFNSGNILFRKIKYRNQPSLLININGTVSYPKGYLSDGLSESNEFLIGITFNEFKELMISING